MPYKSKQSALFGDWKVPVNKETRLWYRPNRRTVNAKLRQAILDALPFGITQEQADLALHAIFDLIGVTVMNGERVTVSGFGRFFLQKRPRTRRRSGFTNESVGQPKSYVNFTPCQGFLKDLRD
jgi:nucleoid DNA-binding protein